jgi:HK97 family phage prohead protease
MTFETRTVAAEFEMRDDSTTGAPILEGYAATFSQPYDLGPFMEQIDRRAFDRTLSLGPDVRLLVDHEGQPLARTKSGTLELSTDSQGLHARATLDPSDPDVQRLLPKMRRGDLDEMSFAFRVPAGGDSWDHSNPERTLRTLNEVSLAGGDVSVVTYPANPTTSVSVRAKDLHEARCVFVEQMAREIRAGNSLPAAAIAKLKHVLDLIAAADDAVDKAQPVLAEVLGVPNPDADEAGEPAEAPAARGLHPDTLKRLLAASEAAINAA